MISIEIYRCAIGLFNFSIAKTKIKSRLKYNNLKISYFSFLFIFIFLCVPNSYSKVCKLNNNRISHIKNGNISKNGSFSMLSWNKGNSLFEKKRDDISITLDRHKPDIFAIHEANFNSQVNKGLKNYNLEYKTLDDRCTFTHNLTY